MRQRAWGCVSLLALIGAAAATRPATQPGAAPATQPASQPSDPTMSWLLSQAPATQPAATSEPTTAPSPFTATQRDESRQATMLLSNGQKIVGRFVTTPGEPIRAYDVDKQEYRDLRFAIIKSMEAQVLWEREQPEWKFKESGSDVKEYSGKTYPARETQYLITLENGQKFTGAVAAPLYLLTPTGSKLYVIHKRDKGEDGQALTDLVYIQRIDFAD